MRAVSMVVCAAYLGCSRGPAPGVRSLAASAGPSASTTTVARPAAPLAASTVADRVGDSPAPPLPAVPVGADAERVLLASSICAAAVLPRTNQHVEVGCRSHPPFTEPEQQPDGTLPVHSGDPLTFCALDGVYRGSFTRATAKQAVLSFSQCKENDPDAPWDSGFPGSAVLVEEVKGRWRAVDYEGGINANNCLTDRRADGRDVLFCQSAFGAGGIGAIRYIMLLDFTRSGKRAGTVLRLFDDDSGCGYLARPGVPGQRRLPSGLISVRIADARIVDRNKDGTGDLVVEVDRARVPPSGALDARLDAACKRNVAPNNRALFPLSTRTQLELLSDGDGFAPSAPTRKVLDEWRAESPEGLDGLAGALPAPFVN